MSEEREMKGQGELFKGPFSPPTLKNSGEKATTAEEGIRGELYGDTLFEKNLKRGIIG